MIEELKKLLIENQTTQEDESTLYTYGVFDGVKYPKLWENIDEYNFLYDNLFVDEKLRIDLVNVAPYIIRIDFNTQNDENLNTVLDMYGKGGCIFFTSTLPFEQTLEKTRDIFIIEDKGEGLGYLRFYSPYIFEELVMSTYDEHIRGLFKYNNKYFCEKSNKSDDIVIYEHINEKVFKNEIILEKEKENV